MDPAYGPTPPPPLSGPIDVPRVLLARVQDFACQPPYSLEDERIRKSFSWLLFARAHALGPSRGTEVARLAAPGLDLDLKQCMYALMTPRQFNGVIFLDQSPLAKSSCKILPVFQLADPNITEKKMGRWLADMPSAQFRHPLWWSKRS